MTQMPNVSVDTLPSDLVRACSAFYATPRDAQGRFLGPLVGYAGRDEQGRNYVGDTYLDFAQIEQWPFILAWVIAEPLSAKIAGALIRPNVYCGAPEGGKALATVFAQITSRRYVYPEKEVLATSGDGGRKKTTLKFSRHAIHPGDAVIIVEDVCNNFSTTEELINLIESFGGTVVGVTCFLNRSELHVSEYVAGERRIPIFCSWYEAMRQWRQDDPQISEHIASGNVVWHAKAEWPRLLQIQENPYRA